MNPQTSGRLGGLATHAKHSSREIAARARSGLDAKFLREVDPEGVLSEPERIRRATAAKKKHFARLAEKSAAARRKAGGLPVKPRPPDRREENRAALLKRYGLTPKDYTRILEKQGWGCALCGDIPPLGKNLNVDVNIAGFVRGLLCKRCSTEVSAYERLADVPGVESYLTGRVNPVQAVPDQQSQGDPQGGSNPAHPYSYYGYYGYPYGT